MNKKILQVFIAFTLLVGGTAALLAKVRTSYQLGTPGVRLGNTPLYDRDSNLVATVSVELPETALACSSTISPIDSTEVAMLPPDTVYGRRQYQHPSGFNAAVSVVLMGTDRTSIHKPQYCLQGQGWVIEGSEVIDIPIAKPHPYDLKVMKLSLSNQIRGSDGNFTPVKGYFIYWFVAENQLTPYHLERMWWMGRDLLTKGVLERWAYVAYLSACWPGQEDRLLAQLKEFIAATVPEFQIATGEPREPKVSDSAAVNSLAISEGM